MAYSLIFNPFILFMSLSIILIHLPLYQAINDGFSVELIRKKPTFLRPKDTTQTNSYAYLGQHLLELSIGTPPVKIYGILDTGSDLIWAQCVPCDTCYKQLKPLFDPKKSSTYKIISCQSDKCHQVYSSACSAENMCDYSYGYADSSVTHGVVASETITLNSSKGKPVQLDNIIFGCGHNNTGTFNDHEMGIIGLSKAPTSLITQIGAKKFSQCLVPFGTDASIPSKMSFGKGSEVLGDGVISTPLVNGPIGSSYSNLYFVTLLGISVEDTRFDIGNNPETVPKGNMLIDSGTPPTVLQEPLYEQVFNEVRKRVPMNPMTDDPSQLCYETATNLKGPMITMHFEGADLKLSPFQTFIPPKDGVFCLAFSKASNGDSGTLGNFAQANFLIGYDLENNVVSFKPTDCKK